MLPSGLEAVRVLRLVADGSLGFCVRGGRRFGHVFPLPSDLVGADEHDAVDFGFELEGQGGKTAGVGGNAFGRGAGFIGVAGCVDDKAQLDVVGALSRHPATVEWQVGGQREADVIHVCGGGPSMCGDEETRPVLQCDDLIAVRLNLMIDEGIQMW